ncbi:MAG: SMI1/KNR4 family protein [Eubacteriaceae bacterium]|nr:SMI1/KNR4 family protein [Eubacteriaceae bacterium]
MDYEEMFADFEFNGKPEEIIRSVNGLELPEDYLSFMEEHNGGEGPLGENCYGCFYPLEELSDVNDEYEVQKWWPGFVVLGSDMGGMLWAYNPVKKIYCQIDSCNTDDDTYSTAAGSLWEFLQKMDKELA